METQTLGFSHFLMQTDAVGKFLLAVLLIMSVASWYLIVTKTIRNKIEQRKTKAFLDFFWNAHSLDQVRDTVAAHRADEPFSHLAHHAITAREHHARFGASRLEEAGSASDFLTRTIRKVIDEETARMESGLTVLASVGATAPFVGLFGTVWGIMHSFIEIAKAQNTSLAVVAPGIAEALLATGIGLVAAIPAVIYYNKLSADADRIIGGYGAFADEFSTILSRQLDS